MDYRVPCMCPTSIGIACGIVAEPVRTFMRRAEISTCGLYLLGQCYDVDLTQENECIHYLVAISSTLSEGNSEVYVEGEAVWCVTEW